MMEDKNIDFLNNKVQSMSSSVDDLFVFFDANPINYDKFDENSHKTAYPNYEHYVAIPGTHNVSKWLSALKEIHFLDKNGTSRSDAIKKVTSDWKKMEVFDFLNWIRFYEESNHIKYKKAQFLPNNTPNYFLKMKEQGRLQDKMDIDFALSDAANSMSLSEKKRIIEHQRNKIISRLDSAEKLLRTEEGEMFAGKDLESLINSIYSLKTKIQLVNKLSLATKLYEDMIVREANVLEKNGQFNGAKVLNLIAEGTDISELAANPTIEPASAQPPTVVSGDPGGLPSMGPGMPQTPGTPGENINPDPNVMSAPPPEIDEVDESAGVIGFLNNLSGGGILPSDQLNADDNILVTEAQAIPETPPIATAPKQTSVPTPTPTPKPKRETEINLDKKDDGDLSVSEDDEVSSTSRVDGLMDSVFNNITVDDVISKLEDLSKVFNTREIPRQLSIVDMMLDSLGLATYFPSLPEATNKALESNNYIATRIDDILAKLRGNLSTHDIDLDGDDAKKQTPEVQNIMKNLENENEKETKRKQMRKEKDDKALEESVKEEPEVDLGDLSEQIPAPAPAPAPAVTTPTPKA